MKAFEFLDKVGKIDTNTMVLDKAIGYNTLWMGNINTN